MPKTRPHSSNKFVLRRREELDRRRANRRRPRTAEETSRALANAGSGFYRGLQPSQGPSRVQRRGNPSGPWHHRDGEKALGDRRLQALTAAPFRAKHEQRRTFHWTAWREHRQTVLEEFREALDKKGIRDLKVAARNSEVKGYGRMTKARLISAITRAQFPHPCP